MQRQSLFIFFLILLFISPVNSLSQTLSSEEENDLKQGIANLNEENYEEAVEDFKKAREYNPNSSIAAYFLGIACKKVQNYKEAKIHLKDAITLLPHVREAVVELADVLYQLEETEEALTELENAESQGIETPQTLFLKGLVLLRLRREIVVEENVISYKGSKFPFTKNDNGTITIEEGPLSGRRFSIANTEAIETFKKAKFLDTSLATSADYQIAMAALQEGRLNEARDIFQEIVIRDPNADIAQFANQYINAITKRMKEERVFRVTVNIQYQHDDNVVLKPSDVTVAGDISGEADSAGVTLLRAEYVPKLKSPFGFKTQYSLYQNLRGRLKDFDIQSHTFAFVPGYNFTKSSINLQVSGNLTRVANLDFFKNFAISPSYTIGLRRNQFATISVEYQDKEYMNASITPDENRDSIDYSAGLSWVYLIAENKGFLNARYMLNKEETEGINWRYQGNRFGLSLLHPVIEKMNVTVGGEVYLQNFDNIHTALKKKRDDKTYTFNTMLSYAISDDIEIQLQYVYTRSDSNIAIYGYNKNMVSAGIEIQW
ncbi:MAG: tetratricopeptide repeat protein [Nitrospinae bacterium]|nr:tetratricopeptide repeat protein [Nitrospinota bacterium]